MEDFWIARNTYKENIQQSDLLIQSCNQSLVFTV